MGRMAVEAVTLLSGKAKAQKKKDQWGRKLAFLCALTVILLTLSIVIFISSKGLSTFFVNGVSVKEFFFSTEWAPDRIIEEGGPKVGVLAFIFGSVTVSLLAVLISAPLSFITAIFMVEIAPGWGQRILQPTIELLAGIPSVVYGYIGLSVLVPFIREHVGGLGFSLLAGVMVLSVMVIPTIVSMSVDSLRALSPQLKEAAYALGSTRWQTIRLVLLPAAKTGLFTGVILGLARAFGEALAVQMVIGNTKQIPESILDQMATLTSGITMDMGYTVVGSLWNNTLWSMAMILLLMSFFSILIIRRISKRGANC